MNDDAIKTGHQLTEVLEQENAALRRADYTAAVALVPRKEALIQALSGHVAAIPPARLSPLTAMGTRLRALAAENQDLLNRAIDVQARLVRIVAQAAVQAQPTYTPNGLRSRPVRAEARSLSAKA